MSSLSYLGSSVAPICRVLAWSPASICMALASSVALKALAVRGMAGRSSVEGTRRLSSLSSAAATTTIASSMLSYSQSSARYALASTVIAVSRNLELEVGIARDGHELDVTWPP
jgi:hypothetical protein